MDLHTYEVQFSDILSKKNTSAPYDAEAYYNYVKMNEARIKRWKRKGKLMPEIEEILNRINQEQNWILITEPWCGDAAHINPFIEKMAAINPKINLIIQNRDAPNSEINKYLTNGSKSIPILIVRDEHHQDLFVWGPRPQEAQEMVMTQKAHPTMDVEEHKINLQKWYNKDKGSSVQLELKELFAQAMTGAY